MLRRPGSILRLVVAAAVLAPLLAVGPSAGTALAADTVGSDG